MYFTREPIVETVITSKEGYKLVLRNSKSPGGEEYFVDAVEVISFGPHCFYRSLEKSKAFLLPVSDYEIVELRETKMVLKTPNVERGIKIGGGREGAMRPSAPVKEAKEKMEDHEVKEAQDTSHEQPKEERKRDRRRFRKRKEESAVHVPEAQEESGAMREEKITLIPPPSTLISETISRYKDLPGFAGAFFDREGKKEADEDAQPLDVHHEARQEVHHKAHQEAKGNIKDVEEEIFPQDEE